MIATWNLPGSSNFNWFRGTKTQCETWQESMAKEDCRGWIGLNGGGIYPEKEARKWKYLDGSHIFGRREFGKWVWYRQKVKQCHVSSQCAEKGQSDQDGYHTTDEQEKAIKEFMTLLYEWGCLKTLELPEIDVNFILAFQTKEFIGYLKEFSSIYITEKGLQWVEKHDWCPNWKLTQQAKF